MNQQSVRNREPTGAQVLVGELRRHGVDRIFCVPGESYLSVLDALLECPEISVVTCRHEGAATMMAEAYGKLTGKPGIVFVTRGPGATNGSSGIHVAHQDSTPLIMFIGQIARDSVERGAFQEIDYRSMFASFSKWATQIEDAARVPEIVGRAFHVATAGRPGPVVIALPEDMLGEAVAEVRVSRAYSSVQPKLTGDDAKLIGTMLEEAGRPTVIVGGGGWNRQTAENAARFAEAWDIPIVASFRCQDYIDNRHPNYIGNLGLGANPALVEAIQTSDLVLAIGARLGEVSSNGYSLLRLPAPEQKFIHIHADVSEIGRIYQPALGLNASSSSALRELAAIKPRAARPPGERVRKLREVYEAWTTPPKIPGAVQMGEIMLHLRKTLPADAIVANGAGNFAIWPNRYHRYGKYRSMLAPTSGSMGYGFPAAVAAKLQHPEKVVVAFCGDGDFLMTGQELATAAKEGAAVIVIVINNNMYGTIRMHQEREYPSRISATDLLNPDFVQLAKAYGADALRITRTEQFFEAFDRAVLSKKSTLLEIILDDDVITPTDTISALRKRSQDSRKATA